MTSTRNGAVSIRDVRDEMPDASVNAAAILKAASLCGVLGTKSDGAPRLLGLHSVRGIAAAACLDRVLTIGVSATTADLKGIMRHSRATAAAA